MHHSPSPTPRTPRTTRTPSTRRNAKLVGSPKAQTKTKAKSRSPKRSSARITSPASSSLGLQPPASSKPNLPEPSQTPIRFQPPHGIPQPAQEIESSASGTENMMDKEMPGDLVKEGSAEPEVEQTGSPGSLAGHEEAQISSRSRGWISR